MNKLFTLQVKDFIKGLVLTVLASSIAFLYLAVQSPDFSFAAIDWNSLGVVAFSSFLGYLAKNFGSSEKGITEEKVMGVTLEKKS